MPRSVRPVAAGVVVALLLGLTSCVSQSAQPGPPAPPGPAPTPTDATAPASP